jgi:16S rRNA (uracil1498-N3)-methyltransferase
LNLILLSDSDFISPHRIRLTGRRFAHIQEILKAECGQQLTVGKINGLVGQGTVKSKTKEVIELDVKLESEPPEALSLTLVLALPRPPMLKRILFSAAMLGVKEIIILNFNRVEKSLWNSSSLKSAAITEQLILGLEQSKDTVMPEVILKKAFKPFVQDELPGIIKGKTALVAHPHKFPSPSWGGLGRGKRLPIVLIIGPEGGIIDYELELLKTAGCQTIDLGPRILRTEYVLPYVVGRLFS